MLAIWTILCKAYSIHVASWLAIVHSIMHHTLRIHKIIAPSSILSIIL